MGEGSTSTSETASPSSTAKPAALSAVILNGTETAGLASSTKTELGGKVDTLPEGETKPSDADFLIIVGE